MTLSWIYSVSLAVKEMRVLYTLQAVGLSGAVLWLGWLLSCLWLFLLSTIALMMVLRHGDFLP